MSKSTLFVREYFKQLWEQNNVDKYCKPLVTRVTDWNLDEDLPRIRSTYVWSGVYYKVQVGRNIEGR